MIPNPTHLDGSGHTTIKVRFHELDPYGHVNHGVYLNYFEAARIEVLDAVGFGLNAVDHLIVVPQYPQFDTKTRLTEHKESAGGQTATAMVALQRLGMTTAYAGRFGSDEAGRFGRESLISEGINVDYAETIEGATNQVAFIIIDELSGERTIIWDRDERLSYQADEVPIELAARGRVLHIDAHDPPACVAMAQAAHAAGHRGPIQRVGSSDGQRRRIRSRVAVHG